MSMGITDILMNSKCYEVNGYWHNVDILTISHLLGVSFLQEVGAESRVSKWHTPTLSESVYLYIKNRRNNRDCEDWPRTHLEKIHSYYEQITPLRQLLEPPPKNCSTDVPKRSRSRVAPLGNDVWAISLGTLHQVCKILIMKGYKSIVHSFLKGFESSSLYNISISISIYYQLCLKEHDIISVDCFHYYPQMFLHISWGDCNRSVCVPPAHRAYHCSIRVLHGNHEIWYHVLI